MSRSAGLTEELEQRRHLGVYTTPPAVVSAQVNLIQDLLRSRFAVPDGLGAPDVVIVDPATGSGAYPMAVAHLASNGLAGRMHLFESRADAASQAAQRLTEQLGTIVTVDIRDALAQPMPIEGPLVVCLGNPPYNRQLVAPGRTTGRKGGFVRFAQPRPILHDFFTPDAGVHHKSLYNDYVYFWRWALWAVCEQRRGPGIVSLLTASSFLRGPGFGGMRTWLRQQLDEVWVLDLEGDGRGTRKTDNVFADVLTPVAITMGARYGDRSDARLAPVHYARLAGTRAEKLGHLARLEALSDVDWHCAPDGQQAVFVPRSTSRYAAWPRLTDLFPRQFAGCQMKRRWPIAPSAELLEHRWATFLALPADERAAAFGPTRDRTTASRPGGLVALSELASDAPCPAPVRYAYRSFDRQWLLADPRLGDFTRPALWQIAGPDQVFLTSLLTHPLGKGPAAVATRLVPDLDHFRGSFGGRAVLPLWCDAAATQPNLAPGLLSCLEGAYGIPVAPRDFLGYCYALLSTPAYQARFEEELREPGARVPVTASRELFQRAAALGERLLKLHTFAEVPPGRARSRGSVFGAFRYDGLALRIGDIVVGPVDQPVWDFSISGLPVVKSWLRYRQRAHGWSRQIEHELLELLWLLEATLELQPALEAALDDVVAGPTQQVLQQLLT